MSDLNRKYKNTVFCMMFKDKNLYGSTLVKIPTPRFVVFYNGNELYPARKTEYLSDAFEKQAEESELELAVTVINLNYGNAELLEMCRSLKEYMLLVQKVREYALEMDIETAVKLAVDECIREGILAEFLTQNRTEVIEVSILEYDEEKVLRFAREDGRIEGKIESILELLAELGVIPQELRSTISGEEEPLTLNRWLKLAAKAESIEEFVEKMN